MDQNLAQIDVASLADAEQLRLASGGILPWHDPKPISEVCMFAVNGGSWRCELLLHEHLAGGAERHKVKARLAQVDANRMYLDSDDPPCQKLPLRSSCSSREIKRRTISLVGFSSVLSSLNECIGDLALIEDSEAPQTQIARRIPFSATEPESV